MPLSPSLDVICLGRAAVDLYGEQPGADLESTSHFSKYLGGSAANIAVGCARLGLQTGLLSCVGAEPMGQFVIHSLADAGVHTRHIVRDPQRLTGLVLLALHDTRHVPHLFYRQDCADMALSASHIDPAYIASARCLVITGTHLSQPTPNQACREALRIAGERGLQRVLDIDFRPVLWGLLPPAEGEARAALDPAVSACLQALLGEFELIVGTAEEFCIAGASRDLREALCRVRELSGALLLVKQGAAGCQAFAAQIPAELAQQPLFRAPEVRQLNPLGAGDAFLAGFLRGWLDGAELAHCCRLANSCGALVASRHGCAPAIPSRAELERFLQGDLPVCPDQDASFRRLHRISTRPRRWSEVHALAFDHRWQFEALAEAHGRGEADILRFKQLLAATLREIRDSDALLGKAGLLLDERYGAELLPTFGADWWLARPVEVSGSRPLRLIAGEEQAQALRRWPIGHQAKCLVYYHPDDEPHLRAEQDRQLLALQLACEADERDWLLEVLAPEGKRFDDHSLPACVEHFYRIGLRPDWWKLPPLEAPGWTRLEALIERYDPYCLGVLLLGLQAEPASLGKAFRNAAPFPICRGFAVGRTIFDEPAVDWFAGRIDDATLSARLTANFRLVLSLWRQARSWSAGT